MLGAPADGADATRTPMAALTPRDPDLPPSPKPDRVTIWPLDDTRFGVDVTYEGASGYELASRHEAALTGAGLQHSFRQELGGAWTVRLTIPAGQVAFVVSSFVGENPSRSSE
jgi:hypothetical protein